MVNSHCARRLHIVPPRLSTPSSMWGSMTRIRRRPSGKLAATGRQTPSSTNRRSAASPAPAGKRAATSRTRTEPSNDSHTSCSRALSTAMGRREMRKYNPPSRSR